MCPFLLSALRITRALELNDAWVNRQDLTVGEVLQSNRCLCRLKFYDVGHGTKPRMFFHSLDFCRMLMLCASTKWSRKVCFSS